MLRKLFNKRSLVYHIHNLMVELGLAIHDIECLAYKYKQICLFLYKHGPEYSHMMAYINGINDRMCNILNQHNVIHNIYEFDNIDIKPISYLKQMILEIIDVSKSLEKEFNDIATHYNDNIMHHYNYVLQSDIYNRK